MLMNFSNKYNGTRSGSCDLPERRGHGVARINNSILVVGGRGKSGKSINRVHRINCCNNRIDSLILDNSLELQGFSIFPHQETLFIWGGRHLSQYTNQLLQFNGTAFTPLKQYGAIPHPRAHHSSATFANKYFIIYGGNDGSNFYKDWHILNLKTGQWSSLQASFSVGFCMSSAMVWVNGRGILVTNNECVEAEGRLRLNNFYQFYVSDYKKGHLKVIPIQISYHQAFNQHMFTSLSLLDKNTILLIASPETPPKKHSDHANPTYILTLDEEVKVQKFKLKLKSRRYFETIVYMNKLFVIGGINQADELTLDVYEMVMEKEYKRNVCAGCRLYFDQQWVSSSKECFTHSITKEDYDYNYFLKIDNRILHKFSQYITHQLYALTLLIQQLLTFTPTNILISTHQAQYTNHPLQPPYYFLKMNFALKYFHPKTFLKYFLLYQISQSKGQEDSLGQKLGEQEDRVQLELIIMKMKLGLLKLGQSCVLSVKVSKQEIYVIYFSYNQLNCTNNLFLPFSNYHYHYNSKTGLASSPLAKHIIQQNVRAYALPKQYQQIGDKSMSMIILCKEELIDQLHITSCNPDSDETGESQIINSMKEENRNVSLLQLAFLHHQLMPSISIGSNRLNFIRIAQVLEGDHKKKILQKILKMTSSTSLFEKIMIYHHPSSYWFKNILIYHHSRLIMDFKNNRLQICGILILKDNVKVDMCGNRLASLQDEQKLKQFINTLSLGKRSKSHAV